MTKHQIHPDYENLPEGIKLLYTSEEYAWLSDEEKTTLEDRETLPEE